MSFITRILNGFLNIFRSAASKAWNSLSKDLQNHALTASSVVQIIKTTLDKSYIDVVVLISRATGFDTAAVNSFIIAVGKDAGITANSAEMVFNELQRTAKDIDTDNGWNAFFQNLAKFGANFLSGGKLDWVSLSYGIIQIAFEKLFKK